jgi:branched-chain amino acid transport system ATP-binding protein
MVGASLSLDSLVLRFGGLIATDNVTLEVPPGELHAIIGPNGAGKSTLIAQLGGDRRPNSGSIRFDSEDVTALPPHARASRGLGRSFQITSVFRDFSALANVALAVQVQAGHSMRFWKQARNEVQLIDPALRILEQVGLGARADVVASDLAHGEKRALEIAIALAAKPRLLLLDEPIAGMGPEEASNMIALLRSVKGAFTIILVEHDMDAVFSLADRISVLVYGKIIATGTPADIRANADVRRAYLGEDEVADA